MLRLLLVAVASGLVSGLVWFALQLAFIVPLIEKAETYEEAATPAQTHQHSDGQQHVHAEWQPADGLERNALTAAATILTSIGLSFVLCGAVSAMGRSLTTRQGVLWGVAAFLCFSAAPAIGLPPQPPGVPLADITHRQLWWLATVVFTAAGLGLLSGVFTRNVASRLAGPVLLALPHLAGAPTTSGHNPVPPELTRQFAIACVLAAGLFWVVLGTCSGYLLQRFGSAR